MLLDLPEDAELLSRSSSLDRSVSTSGRSFGRLACVATLVVGACCGALAVSSGHASWVTPTHAMGSSKHGAIHSSRMHGNITPKTTIQSAHVAGSKPTVFVVSSVDPGKDESFEQFKADLLTQLDDPELIGRFEWSGTVSATQLPVHIERYEEATSGFEDGLSVLTGTYVGQKHEWKNKIINNAFFQLDDGKKMVVEKSVVYDERGALGKVFRPSTTVALGSENDLSHSEESSAEISEPEKKSIGDAIGVSVAHLLSWRRASQKRVGDSGAIQGGGAHVMDTQFKASVKKNFVKMVDALSAFRPSDADVIFLDSRNENNVNANDAGVVLRRADWGTDIEFLPVSGNPKDTSTLTAHTAPSFYYVSDLFLEKVFTEIESSGFEFVGDFLHKKCSSKTFTCYDTSPGFGTRVKLEEEDS